MKIELFKKKNNFKKKDAMLPPETYWKYTVLGACLLILATFFFSYNLFMKINQKSTLSSADSNAQVQTVNKNRLEKALNVFSDRANKSAAIVSQPAPVVDPSL